jgi:predicted metal-dependent hydrolase
MQKKAAWLVSKIDFFKRTPVRHTGLPRRTHRNYIALREQARELIKKKVAYFSSIYGYVYGKVSVKNQKGRWASCSEKGNLNFNYRILFLQERMQNYIVVHELCHLKELNHSRRFWNLVAAAVPDYSTIRTELRHNTAKGS